MSNIYLKGFGISGGVGIGKAVILDEQKVHVTKSEANAAQEKKRLENSVQHLTKTLYQRAEKASKEQAEILKSHIDMLGDPVLLAELHAFIQAAACNCDYAVSLIFDRYIREFQSSGNELLALRASDLNDVKQNLITTIQGGRIFDAAALPEGSILVARELTATIALGIDPHIVQAVVTRIGGKDSHMAIIARSLGLPAVAGMMIDSIRQEDCLIVDGDMGFVCVKPSEKEIEEARLRQKEERKRESDQQKYIGMKSVTSDQRYLLVCANISLEGDIEEAVKADAEGVGLFRTEFLYMDRNAPPTEEEQFQIYKKAAVDFKGKPVTIRTLDIGGDKAIPYLNIEKEANPFLGNRAIRYCLEQKELFGTQIRAILRSSAFGKIKIMIPMVSTITEWNETISIIEEIKRQLISDSVSFQKEIEIGMMIETPASAVLSDVFAKKADFFSIGTNDLTQYIMAADRGNEKVASLYNVYDPAVMRLIYSAAQTADQNHILCGVCGEAGTDPLFVKFLIGCGVQSFSVGSRSVLRTREVIRNSSYKRLSRFVAERIFELETTEEAFQFLHELNQMR